MADLDRAREHLRLPEDKESAPVCGFGAELALVLPYLAAWRRRSRRSRRE